jgi:hypothetical protein
MKSNFLFPVAIVVSSALMACGGGGPTLGNFPAITKTVGDEPFTLTAPSSDGPGAFSYTSSNAAVATIAGNVVTIVGAGTSTITANQAASGSYNASSTSATLTVNPRACTEPATRVDGVCTAPATAGTVATNAGKTWMPVTFSATWSAASSFCTSTKINGSTGWRLPTDIELSDLRSSGAMTGLGWTLSRTWSSTPGALAAQHKTVRLDDGVVADAADGGTSYVACVK